MKVWLVRLMDGREESVTADYCTSDGGRLLFTDMDAQAQSSYTHTPQKVKAIYQDGAWASVRLSPELTVTAVPRDGVSWTSSEQADASWAGVIAAANETLKAAGAR